MSRAEEEFLGFWNEHCPDLPLQREQPLVPGRRFRFDFSHAESLTALELDGGGWVHGRHHRPRGRMRDYEKDLLAAELGWQTLRFAPDQVDLQLIDRIRSVMEQRLEWLTLARGLSAAHRAG